MAAKPEFSALTFTPGQGLSVEGPAGDDSRDSDRVYWLVTQGATVGMGVAVTNGGGNFSGAEDPPGGNWTPGQPATAFGVLVGHRTHNVPGIETFTWIRVVNVA